MSQSPESEHQSAGKEQTPMERFRHLAQRITRIKREDIILEKSHQKKLKTSSDKSSECQDLGSGLID